MITYTIVHPENIKSGTLSNYRRYTETHRVKYIDDGVIKEKDDFFIDDWDSVQLTKIEKYMQELQNRTILAKEGTQVVGFVVLDVRLFDGYMNMPYIHTDNRYRGKGIGTKLMHLASKMAKELGAKKLYISTHPSVEAQKFYMKMGCVLAKKINQVLYELEPFDIQLELSLDNVDLNML